MNILRSGAASAVALLMLTVAPGPLMSGAAAQEATKVASGHTLAIQVNQGQLLGIGILSAPPALVLNYRSPEQDLSVN